MVEKALGCSEKHFKTLKNDPFTIHLIVFKCVQIEAEVYLAIRIHLDFSIQRVSPLIVWWNIIFKPKYTICIQQVLSTSPWIRILFCPSVT